MSDCTLMYIESPQSTTIERPNCQPKASPDQCVQIPMPTQRRAMGVNTMTAQARSSEPE